MKITKKRKGKERELKGIPHEDGCLRFVASVFGPGNHFALFNSIFDSGFDRPTVSQLSSLIYDAWQTTDEKHSARVIDSLRRRLFASNGVICVPEGSQSRLLPGVYVQDHPTIRDGGLVLDEADLISRLRDGDSSVRYIEPSFDSGRMTYSLLGTNRFVVALAGEDGAHKLSMIDIKPPFQPILEFPSFQDSKEVFIGFPSLSANLYQTGLEINCGHNGLCSKGYTYAVSGFKKVKTI